MTETYIPPASLLAEIQRVAEEGTSKQEAQKLFDWLIEDYKNRTRMVVLATLQARVTQFLSQATLVREVDRRLADEDRLKRASNHELISLRRTVIHDMHKMLELILPKLGPLMGEEEEPPQSLLSGHMHFHMHSGPGEGGEKLPISRSQQESLVRFFSAFDQHLSGRDLGEIPPPESEPSSDSPKKKKRGRRRKKE